MVRAAEARPPAARPPFISAVMRSLVIVLLLVSLGGCSGVTFVYNRLGFLITWNVDDYVNLSGAQKKELRTLLKPFLAWHRSQELPQYLITLENTEALLERPLQAEDVEALAIEFEQAWYRTESAGLEWMISFGEQLSDAQIAEFLESLKERQADFEEEYLARSEAEFREEAYDNMLDPAQDYLGRLSADQRALLERASNELLRSDSTWLEERAAWLIRLEEMLQRQPGWQQVLRETIAQRQKTTSDEYIDVYAHNAGVIYTALAALLNSRSDKQDKHLRGKLEDLRDDLQTLIAKGQAKAA